MLIYIYTTTNDWWQRGERLVRRSPLTFSHISGLKPRIKRQLINLEGLECQKIHAFLNREIHWRLFIVNVENI